MRKSKMSVIDLLEQDKIWITREGQMLTLEEMEPRHRRNTLALLRRSALGLNFRYFMRYFGGPGPNGDMGSLLYERAADEFIDQKVDEWIEEQPLVRRLQVLVIEDGIRERRAALNLVRHEMPQHGGRVARLGGIRHGE